jgi:16S rRNA (adenine1518-N6/adenine1519-N6)-dimethyltransferase
LSRKLGQHFLLHEATLKQIAEAACGEHTARVIEIGPGRGALTKHLLPLTDELNAIELDEALIVHLRGKFKGEPKLKIHHGDVLATDLGQWGPAVIAGNLPYYIGSAIIEKYLAMSADFGTAVFLLQWEVAARILARGGGKAFGFLSVAVQVLCDVELVCRVPPKHFNPPPKVDSAAIKLTRRGELQLEDREAFLAFAKRCFASKRRTIRNNLLPYYGEQIAAEPEAQKRAEQLDTPGLLSLFRRLEAKRAE